MKTQAFVLTAIVVILGGIHFQCSESEVSGEANQEILRLPEDTPDDENKVTNLLLSKA